MKYRILKNENGKYRIQFREWLWFIPIWTDWVHTSKYNPFDGPLVLLDSIEEAQKEAEEANKRIEELERSKKWKAV